MNYTKNVTITFVSRIIQLLIALGITVIIARSLGPEKKGIHSLAILLSTLLITFTELGIGPASVFFIGKKKYDIKHIFGTNIIFSVLISFVAIIIGLIIIYFFKESTFPGISRRYLLLGLMIIPFSVFQTFVIDILLGTHKFKKYNFVQILQSLIFLFSAAFLLIGLHLGISAAIVAQVISLIISCIIVFTQTIKETNGIHFLFNKQILKDFFSYSSKYYFNNLLSFLHLRVDVFMINIFLNPLSVGYYSIAVGLAERIWIISKSAGIVIFPKVSSETNKDKLKEFTPIVTRNILFITLIMILPLIAFGKFIIEFLYSNKFLDSIFPFYILLIGTIATGGSRILSNDLAGRGRLKESLYTNSISVFLNIILNIILIPRMGISGAAIATTISYSLSFSLRVIIYAHISGNKIIDILVIKKSDFKLYKNFILNVKGNFMLT